MIHAKEKINLRIKKKQSWKIVNIINEKGEGEGEKRGERIRRELKIEMPVGFALLKSLIGL